MRQPFFIDIFTSPIPPMEGLFLQPPTVKTVGYSPYLYYIGLKMNPKPKTTNYKRREAPYLYSIS